MPISPPVSIVAAKKLKAKAPGTFFFGPTMWPFRGGNFPG
jgi:hypothetical protein